MRSRLQRQRPCWRRWLPPLRPLTAAAPWPSSTSWVRTPPSIFHPLPYQIQSIPAHEQRFRPASSAYDPYCMRPGHTIRTRCARFGACRQTYRQIMVIFDLGKHSQVHGEGKHTYPMTLLKGQGMRRVRHEDWLQTCHWSTWRWAKRCSCSSGCAGSCRAWC